MIIKLNSPQTIVLQVEKTKTVDSLTIQRIVDFPQQKSVKAFIQELADPITLWEGKAYDEIGQWTDEDVEKKLASLYNAQEQKEEVKEEKK